MTEYKETRSHPVMFSRDVFAELLEVDGDRGAREVIRRHRDQVLVVPSVLAEPPADIDTEAAYAALRQMWPD
jgi:molybdenum cofactor cytidylyltransferase